MTDTHTTPLVATQRRPYDPLIAHAAARGRIGLWDGQTATLIAVVTRLRRDGTRQPTGGVRIQFDGTGRLRTVPRRDIAHVFPLEHQ